MRKRHVGGTLSQKSRKIGRGTILVGNRRVEVPVINIGGDRCCDVCHTGDLGGSKSYEWAFLRYRKSFREIVTDYFTKNPKIASDNVAFYSVMRSMGLNANVTIPTDYPVTMFGIIDYLAEKMVSAVSPGKIAEMAFQALFDTNNNQINTEWLLCSACSLRVERE